MNLYKIGEIFTQSLSSSVSVSWFDNQVSGFNLHWGKKKGFLNAFVSQAKVPVCETVIKSFDERAFLTHAL